MSRVIDRNRAGGVPLGNISLHHRSMNPSQSSAQEVKLTSRDKKPFSFPKASTTPDADLSPLPAIASVHVVAHDHNIKQKLITVTEDKTLLCLQRNLRFIGKRRWLHPMSLLLTLLLALATSDFDKLTWISSELLKATFIVSSFFTSVWLIWEIMHDGRLKEIPQAIDDIFREMRAN